MDADAILDLFRPLGPVIVKRMFGGKGVFADGRMFALEADGEIYLKVDDATRPIFEAAGLRPFTYSPARGGEIVMSYCLLHPAAFDDEDELLRWGRLALDASRRSAAGKPRSPRR